MTFREKLREQANRLRGIARKQIQRIRDRGTKEYEKLRTRIEVFRDMVNEQAKREADLREQLQNEKNERKAEKERADTLQKDVTRYERLMGPIRPLKDVLAENPATKEHIQKAINGYKGPEHIDPDTGLPAYMQIARDFGVEARDVYRMFLGYF